MASILVIEDVPAVLLSLRIVLEGSGHQVTGAADGVAGLALIGHASFALVITDIWMPGMGGAEVIRAGHLRSPGTRFLAITGGDPNLHAPRDSLLAQDFGADRVLLKPFEKDQLLAAVAEMLSTVQGRKEAVLF
jgi:CheY-like chemotaxis protein